MVSFRKRFDFFFPLNVLEIINSLLYVENMLVQILKKKNPKNRRKRKKNDSTKHFDLYFIIGKGFVL